jgi:hypothetical protein
MKNISKDEIYSRFSNFCKENPVGLPTSIVMEFNMEFIDELLNEGKLIKHSMGIGGVFYTLTDESGKSIYKRSW